MKIKIFRVVESTEQGDNLMGYGFADSVHCTLKLGTKIITYNHYLDQESSTLIHAFEKMVQDQTDDLRGYRVEYQEYDLGDTAYEFGHPVPIPEKPVAMVMPPIPEWLEKDREKFTKKMEDSGMTNDNSVVRGKIESGMRNMETDEWRRKAVDMFNKLTPEKMEEIAEEIRKHKSDTRSPEAFKQEYLCDPDWEKVHSNS